MFNGPALPVTEQDRLYRLNIFNENLNEIENQKREAEQLNFNPFSNLYARPTQMKQSLLSGPSHFASLKGNHVSSDQAGLINDPLFRNQLQHFITTNQENLPVLKDRNSVPPPI
jgi:hypothetical protein